MVDVLGFGFRSFPPWAVQGAPEGEGWRKACRHIPRDGNTTAPLSLSGKKHDPEADGKKCLSSHPPLTSRGGKSLSILAKVFRCWQKYPKCDETPRSTTHLIFAAATFSFAVSSISANFAAAESVLQSIAPYISAPPSPSAPSTNRCRIWKAGASWRSLICCARFRRFLVSPVGAGREATHITNVLMPLYTPMPSDILNPSICALHSSSHLSI